MKTMIRRILPLGLLLVFAVYCYSQNAATTAPSKDTKTTTSASCSGKSMDNCKTSCTSKDKAKCGGETKSCCKESTGSNCCKGKSGANGCQDKPGTTKATTPEKTTSPKK